MSGNYPLCSKGHQPLEAAALVSLHFTGSLPAGHRIPLTMSDPWKTCSLFLPSFLLILRFILLFIIFTFAPSFLSASLNPLPSFWAVALKEQIRR